MLQVLGPLRVPTPGTPVQVTSIITTDQNGYNNDRTHFTCHAALFQAITTNAGKVYIGVLGMNKTTLAGVAAVLAVPTANAVPSFSISLTLAPAGVDLSELYVDADTATEGVLVTLLIT